jgi:uncharacterized protein YhaN
MSETPPRDSLRVIAEHLPGIQAAMADFPELVEEKVAPVREAVGVLERQNKWFRTVVRWLWGVLIATLISFAFDIGITTWLYFSSEQTNRLATELQQSQQSRYQACLDYNRQENEVKDQIVGVNQAIINIFNENLAYLKQNQAKLSPQQYQANLKANEQAIVAFQGRIASAERELAPVTCQVPPKPN